MALLCSRYASESETQILRIFSLVVEWEFFWPLEVVAEVFSVGLIMLIMPSTPNRYLWKLDALIFSSATSSHQHEKHRHAPDHTVILHLVIAYCQHHLHNVL